jgi:hypothetical protein
MAQYAAAAVRRNTGLSTVVLNDADFTHSGLKKPHHLKFRLFDLVGADEILFFDSDLVCLNVWNPRNFVPTDAIVAVRDIMSPVIVSDAAVAGVQPEEYFNSGLLLVCRRQHQGWLRAAERINDTRGPFRFCDQTALNIARAELRLPVKFLDRRYNWVEFGQGPLCYQIPVFMAHRLRRADNNTNVAFFKGTYQLPTYPVRDLDERGKDSLAGQGLTSVDAGGHVKCVWLREDGTLVPSGELAGGPGYWFVEKIGDRQTLVFASQTAAIQAFSRTPTGDWESVTRLRTHTSLEASAVERLVGQRWFRYVRVGHDQRAMELLPGGRIGVGKAACEETWCVLEEPSSMVVLIFWGRGRETCRLVQNEAGLKAGTWQGRWLIHERMPIELEPSGTGAKTS